VRLRAEDSICTPLKRRAFQILRDGDFRGVLPCAQLALLTNTAVKVVRLPCERALDAQCENVRSKKRQRSNSMSLTSRQLAEEDTWEQTKEGLACTRAFLMK